MNLDIKKPAILQVLPALNTGGVERGVVDLSIAAKQKGYRIIIASEGGRQLEKLEAAGIEHFKLPLKTKNPLKILMNISRLKKLIINENVKLVHARSRAPAWSAYYAAKTANIPFITTFHGFYKNDFPLKKLYNAIMTRGEKIIAVSEFIKTHIVQCYKIEKERIVTVHRGVDMNEFNPEKINADDIASFRKEHDIEDRTVILLPGRITRWKGQDIALKALQKLDNSKLILLMAGKMDKENNFSNELEQFINDNGLKENIRFLGDVKNMPLALAASDIVLSTSIEPETFGRVSAEAGAMGKPVIATNIGGSMEIIDSGNTGYLVDPKDPEQLAEKIEKLVDIISDENKKMAFSKASRERVAKYFSLNRMCDDTLNIYNMFYKFF